MFENLDSVDWENIKHAYGVASDVSDLLRDVVAAQSHPEFDKAIYMLADRVHREGDIYPATAHVVPFLIELLTDAKTSFHRIRYTLMLRDFVASTQLTKAVAYDRFRLEQSISDLRNHLAVYDAVARGLDIFIAQLDDEDVNVRAASIYVLKYLPEQHDDSLPALLRCIENTSHEWTKAVAIYNYADIVFHVLKNNYDPHTIHHDRLLNWRNETDSPVIRYASSIAYLMLIKSSQTVIPDAVIASCAEALEKNVMTMQAEGVNLDMEMDYVYSWLLPFKNMIKHISSHCRQRYNPQVWLDILQSTQFNARTSHLIYRELLDIVFRRQDMDQGSYRYDWHNLEYLDASIDYDSLIYKMRKVPAHFVSARTLSDNQKRVLESIVAYDPFWEIPTNLFSFYYGLPDDRDKLRKLVE